MKWTELEDIAMALVETHEDINPLQVRFTELRQWVLDLPEFDDDPKHCNEKILEAIQQAWYDEVDANKQNEDEASSLE